MPQPNLALLVLKTGRVEECVHFYRQLGLAFMREQHDGGPEHYACQVGEMVLELYPGGAGAGGAAGEAVMLGFGVASLDDALRSLSEAGAAVRSAPRETGRGRRAVVLDPDGRAVELVEWSPPQAAS